MNINKQLQIGVAPKNINKPTRYTRGLRTTQPQLMTEDWSLDFYNDTKAINNMSNMNGGWDESDNWDNWVGDGVGAVLTGGLSLTSYPPCVGVDCKTCKNKCKTVGGLKWLKGGKKCFKDCKDGIKRGTENIQPVIPGQGGSVDRTEESGMGIGAIIGVSVLGLAILGTAGYLLLKK